MKKTGTAKKTAKAKPGRKRTAAGPNPEPPLNVDDLTKYLGLLKAERDEARKDLEAAVNERGAWETTAREAENNRHYYHGLVFRIGLLFGDEGRTTDDGGLADDVLCAKIPRLVEEAVFRDRNLRRGNEAMNKRLGQLQDDCNEEMTKRRAAEAWLKQAQELIRSMWAWFDREGYK